MVEMIGIMGGGQCKKGRIWTRKRGAAVLVDIFSLFPSEKALINTANNLGTSLGMCAQHEPS